MNLVWKNQNPFNKNRSFAMGLIERANLSGSFTVATSLAECQYANLKNASNFALRSTVAQTLTLHASLSENGTYTTALDSEGDPITITLPANNQWIQAPAAAFPYTYCKFLAGTGPATIEFIGKG